jgi:GTPase
VVGVPPGTVVYAVDGRRGGDPAADAALDEDDDDGWWRGEEAGKTQQQQPLPSSGLRLVADLATPGARYVAAPGGAGGVGNAALPKSVERARRRAAAAASPSEAASAGGAALAGSPGVQASLRLELRSLADAGLVGPPNAGKSTLLRALSAARPRVGAYPFTTTRPHLGVLAERTQGDVGNPNAPFPSSPAIAAAATAGAAAAAGAAPPLTLADVPGLLPGAAAGVGLGHDFLRHVSRCAALVLVIDVSTTVAPPPSPDRPHPAVAALGGLLAELGAYEAGLPARPCVIAANKVDACPDGGAAAVAALKASAPPGCVTVVATSGRAGIGLEELAAAVRAAVAKGDE